RGIVIGSAIRALSYWKVIAWTLFRAHILFFIGLPLLILTSPLLWLMGKLIFYESQRAEYFADSLAASVAGTSSTVSMLSKLLFAAQFRTFASNAPRSTSPSTLLPRFRTYIESNLADEGKLAQHEADSKKHADIYSWTHPPILYRKN